MTDTRDVEFEWRGPFANSELNALHAEAFAHDPVENDWVAAVERRSLGWVTARESGELVGFVNVIGDGLVHAFIADTCVAERVRRRGVGAELIRVAREASAAAGCEWLHVDFEAHLQSFYYDACGFTPTAAGLINLR